MEDTRLIGTAYRGKPGSVPDGQTQSLRVDPYGGLLLAGKGQSYSLCDEGAYFVATNPTNGTGIAGIAATGAFSDQESLLVVYNAATAGERKRIYLDYLKLRLTAAGASGTDVLWVGKLDNGDRRGSGGSAIVPVNPNMDSSESFATSVMCQFGAVASSAATSAARLVTQGTMRITIGVVNDTYQLNFGVPPMAQQFGAAAAADSTNVVHRVAQAAPVVIGPGQSFVLSVYQTAQTGASSFEFELAGWIR